MASVGGSADASHTHSRGGPAVGAGATVGAVNAVEESPLNALRRTFRYPAAHAPAEAAAAHTSAFNLVTTIVGCGILGQPFAFASSGAGLGFALLAFTAAVTYTSCNLLLRAYSKMRKSPTARINTYDVLARAFFGKVAGTLVRAAVVLMCCGGCTAYLVVLQKLLDAVLGRALPAADSVVGQQLADHPLWAPAALVVLVVLPLSSQKSLASLGWTSILAFLAACALVVCVGYKAVRYAVGADACEVAPFDVGDRDFTLISNASFPLAIPIFSFSFICQLNVVPVFEDMQAATVPRFRGVLGRALAACVLLYGLMGVFGQLRFCGDTPGNVLLGFVQAAGGSSAHVDGLIVACMAAQCLVCTLSLPMIVYPARQTMHNFFVSMRPLKVKRVEESGSETADELTDLVDVKRHSKHRVFTLTLSSGMTPDPREAAERLNGSPATRGDGDGSDAANGGGRPTGGGDPPARAESTPLLSGEVGPHMTHPLRDAAHAEEGGVGEAGVGADAARRRRRRRMAASKAAQGETAASRVAEAAALLGACFTIAAVAPSFEVVIGFLGATLASLVCYVLPAAFYLWVARNDRPRAPAWKQAVAGCVMVYGFAVSVVGTVVYTLQVTSNDRHVVPPHS